MRRSAGRGLRQTTPTVALPYAMETGRSGHVASHMDAGRMHQLPAARQPPAAYCLRATST